MILLSAILVITLLLLISQWVRTEVVAVSVIATLGLTGILTPQESLTGFANTATITVAAMFVLSAGLERAGVVDYIGNLIARTAHGNTRVLLLYMLAPTAILSAFMNNTAIVALMIPVVLTISRRLQNSPSAMLIPISYISILAGTCTLIGTSTNILVDSLYRDAGGEGFSMFEFSGLGLIYLLLGGVYVVFIAPKLLPHRIPLSLLLNDARGDHFVTELLVPGKSNAQNKAITQLLGNTQDIRLLQIIRHDQVYLGSAQELILQGGDILLVEGTVRAIHELLNQYQLRPATVVYDDERAPLIRMDLRFVEAIVAPNSNFHHRKVQDLKLSSRLGIQVIAVRRRGRHQQHQLRNFRLNGGDVLLLQGEPEALRTLQNEGDVLLVEGVESSLTFPRKAPIAIAILVAVVSFAAMDFAPIVMLALLGVALMLLSGCLNLKDATRALDSSVLFLLVGMIPLGLAMEKTGLAMTITDFVVDTAGPHGPLVLISAFYLLTSILTEVLSNNAAAVLLTPICLGTAASLGIDPKPLLIAVTFGASASFATPIGYQTNTMVMAPGGYTFGDFLRLGVPLNLTMWLAATFLIPWFWPP